MMGKASSFKNSIRNNGCSSEIVALMLKIFGGCISRKQKLDPRVECVDIRDGGRLLRLRDLLLARKRDCADMEIEKRMEKRAEHNHNKQNYDARETHQQETLKNLVLCRSNSNATIKPKPLSNFESLREGAELGGKE